VRAAGGCLARLLAVAQITAVNLAGLSYPLRRGALVGDAHIPLRVGKESLDDGLADRAGAAGYKNLGHWLGA
jgi:hypothetical protein